MSEKIDLIKSIKILIKQYVRKNISCSEKDYSDIYVEDIWKLFLQYLGIALFSKLPKEERNKIHKSANVPDSSINKYLSDVNVSRAEIVRLFHKFIKEFDE